MQPSDATEERKNRKVYRCTVCSRLHDEKAGAAAFGSLPDDWRCPSCNAPKEVFLCVAMDDPQERAL